MLKKRKKSTRLRGSRTGFGGNRKRRKKSGHRGGCGMAGTGKRADHKKSKVLTFDKPYFGRAGLTSRKRTKNKVPKTINIQDLVKNHDLSKEIILKGYKLLGKTQANFKEKLDIKVDYASNSAIEIIKKAGGTILVLKQEKTKPKKEVKEEEAEEEKEEKIKTEDKKEKKAEKVKKGK